MLFGGRGRGGPRRRVERALANEPTWQVQVHGTWLCPFCVTPAVAVSGDRARFEDAILEHLETSCSEYDQGRGAERPLVELRRMTAYRRLRKVVREQLVANPSWQLLDVSRRWFCPYCADATAAAVPPGSRMPEETLAQIIEHVEGCYGYDHGRGQERDLGELKASVRHLNKARKLAETVRRKLEEDPAWRRKDPSNRWICPYCLDAQPHVDLSTTLLMFENAPSLIAEHLVGGCAAYRAGAAPQPVAPPTDPAGREPIPETDPAVRVAEAPPETVSETGPVETGLLRTRPEGEAKALWGRDAHRVEAGGTTLRQLESSGEFLLVDDEVKAIAGSEAPTPAARAESLDVWREEIERELASVRDLSELAPISRPATAAAAPPVDASRLSAFGVEVGRVVLPGDPPRGDFAEAIELDGDRLALIVGGVMGADQDAPWVAALARDLIRERAAPERDPADLLRDVNHDLFAELDGRNFVAVAYALIDLPTGRARFARAGAPAALLRRSGRAPHLERLEPEGMVLGLDNGAIFAPSLSVAATDLGPGDLLALYTTGVLEARGTEGQGLGVDGIEALVRRYGGHEAEYFTDKFKERFALHVGEPHRLTTDACVLALRWTGH